MIKSQAREPSNNVVQQCSTNNVVQQIETDEGRIDTSVEHHDDDLPSDNITHAKCQNCVQNETEIELLNQTLKKTQEKCNNLLEVNTFLSKQLEIVSKELTQSQKEIELLKTNHNKFKDVAISPNEFTTRMKNVLKDTLTSNQIDLITEERKRVRWTKAELSKFFTLRDLGKRAYQYLRDDLNFPAASISTLQRYGRTLNLKQGILNDVINLLKNITVDLPECHRECVLSFDEMKVNRILEYDPASDEVLGPHNYLQVVMARGLFKNWKQPVFIGFDQQMTKEILFELIKRLYAIKINVVAIVSDNCQSNIGCWKDLGAHDYCHPFFSHPITKCNIYVFPDAPHLLKLIRNWLIDTGFEYNNKLIKADKLFELVAYRNAAELTPVHKLTQNHLVMTPQERQNVRRAAEVLSRTTAIALQRYFPDDCDAQELASFIEKVDMWFSVANSYSPCAKLHYKKSFNANENQLAALSDMFELMSNITALGKKSMQVFQKSLLMHITSLKMLYEDMRKKHSIVYISTYKVSIEQ